MKRILILDTKKHQYEVRKELESFGSFLIDNTNSVDDFRLKLYENDPDLVLYYSASQINIHDIIELMMDADYSTTPVLFFTDNDLDEFYNHNLLLGPFQNEEPSFSSIINLGLKYKEVFTKCKELENKETLTKEESFHSFTHFSAQVVQEFKKAKRFKHPLSLVIIQIDSDKTLNQKYPKKVVDEIMLSTVSSIKDVIRDTDIPMSYDENKVLVLMPLTDETGVDLAEERLRSSIKNIKIEANVIGADIDVVIGQATMNEETSKFSEMVKKAMIVFK